MVGPAAARAGLTLLIAALALARPGSIDVGTVLEQQPSSGSTASSGALGSSGGGTNPEGVRLALSGTAGEVTVMWNTQLPTAESCVQWLALATPPQAAQGPSSMLSEQRAGGEQQHIAGPLLPEHAGNCNGDRGGNGGCATAKRLLRAGAAAGADDAKQPGPGVQTACGGSRPYIEPSTGQPSLQLHMAAVVGLPPGQAVRYRCGSADGGWSSWRVFLAPRAAEQFGPDAPVSVQLSRVYP